MLARVFTATMEGLSPIKIDVEVDGISGTPNFILIGLAAKAVDEAKERVTAALQNCGVRIRAKRTIVNLAPADLQKTGTAFELAIAVGLLKMFGEVIVDTDNTMFFGELSLDGALKPIPGILPLVMAAKKMGFEKVFIPTANKKEVTILSGIKIYAIDHLNDYLQFTRGEKQLEKLQTTDYQSDNNEQPEILFEHIVGQYQAKRALQIAAAGGHNIHLIGPPGAGKTLLARCISSILPPLTEQEAIETTSIHSIAGQVNHDGLITTRPFRSPHHTVSTAGLIGGGSDLHPGEISLAHHGILFLDELPEFSKTSIEALRQPLEDGFIHITRAKGSIKYPARFSLLAASNPCPCGYWQSSLKKCDCGHSKRKQYAQKISGPVIDRIDLHTWVESVKVTNHTNLKTPNSFSSRHLREDVISARQIQNKRFDHSKIVNNAAITPAMIEMTCPMTSHAKTDLSRAQNLYKLTTRSYFKIIKIARTIADLEGQTTITKKHISEALQFRPKQLVT